MILNSLKIKVMLKQAEQTQAELAKYLKMNEKAVSKMLNLGTTRESTAIKIAEFLNVPLGEISTLNVPIHNLNMDSNNSKDEKIKDLERIIELQQELIDTLKHKV